MFNKQNKLLGQLRIVQGRITFCQAVLASLRPPTPDSFEISKDMKRWLELLFLQHDPSVSSLIESAGNSFRGNTLDYINKLGEYFVNFANYYRDKIKYDEELEQLQKEERLLKEKLGID